MDVDVDQASNQDVERRRSDPDFPTAANRSHTRRLEPSRLSLIDSTDHRLYSQGRTVGMMLNLISNLRPAEHDVLVPRDHLPFKTTSSNFSVPNLD